jgi:hypothetical protein
MTWNNLREDRLVDNYKIMQNLNALRNGSVMAYSTTDRIALTQSVGLKVYDTTLLKLFISNGTNWVQI